MCIKSFCKSLYFEVQCDLDKCSEVTLFLNGVMISQMDYVQLFLMNRNGLRVTSMVSKLGSLPAPINITFDRDENNTCVGGG